jgi:hypothetical protein
MQNLSDDELDKLFQSAAEHYNAPGAADGWRAMEKKLASAAVQAPWWKLTGWKGWGVVGSGVVMTTVSVWLMYQNDTPLQTKSLATEATPILTTEPTTISQKSENAIENKADRKAIEKTFVQNNPVNRPAMVARKNPLISNNTWEESVNQSSSFSSSGELLGPTPQRESAERTNSSDKIISSTEKDESRQEQSLNIDTKKSNSNRINNTPLVDSTNEKLIGESTAADQQRKENDTVEKKVLNELSRWSVRISASPDFSTVKFDGPYGSGSNYAVQVQYQITEKWEL